MSVVELSQDRWAQWLLQRRHGGDPATLAAMVDDLYRFRDTVLGHAAVTAGEVLLDVGAGDGLIAFGALPLVGEQGTVIFSDISQDLLDRGQALADEVGASDRCRFLRASADNLSAVGDATVDVVTIRSVLIYVPAKQQAVQEFYRVLAPGGRLSIFEPINRFASPEPPHLFCGGTRPWSVGCAITSTSAARRRCAPWGSWSDRSGRGRGGARRRCAR